MGLVWAISLPALAADQASHPAPRSVAADHALPDSRDAKLHAQLRMALQRRAQGSDWAAGSGLPSALRRGDAVLLEVRFASGQTMNEAHDVLMQHGATLQNTLAATLHEVWIPIDRLRELASDASVVRIAPARLARPLASTSQGVAAGNADYWRTFNPSYTGTGITIAVIDSFDKSRIGALQSSGDWPPTARLTCYDVKDIATNPPFTASSCTAGAFGNAGKTHGNATLEIVYDVASGATYRAYDTVTVGDWYNAILDAANVNSSGAALGPVKANVISASLAAPLDGIGDGTAQPGSIAEAAGYARSRGVLVVSAAGDERENHWGGAFQLASSSYHTWDGNSTHIYNFFGNGGIASCIPSGTAIDVSMYWNNWVVSGGHYVANHDYGLYLYENLGSNVSPTWLTVAISDQPQTGGVDFVPQESIQYTTNSSGTTTGGCATNSVSYAIAVVRNAGTTANDNLQVFANAGNDVGSYPLNYRVAARSLDFPADSPNVFSVAAIDVANATTNPQEPFSSEGPVLAAGGDIPVTSPSSDINLKPDLASFDHVTTATYGASAFYGTSAAAAQVSGMAALFMQRFGIQNSATNLINNIVTPLRTIANTGTNDLGTVGKDYQYGYGRLRFQRDAVLAFVQQPTSAAVNAAITPPIKVGIYDGEGKLDSYTLFDALTLALANDPNGGAAVLSGAGIGNMVMGVATYPAAKINLGGNGYTLNAAASAAATPPINLAVTSNPFNVTTGAASKLAFTLQPSAVEAGMPITPAVKVSIEDSNNNVVTSNNTTEVTIMRASCNGIVPAGGGPLTVTNGVATFSGLTLHSAGTSVQLQASATGLFAANSAAFNVSANPDFIFTGGFEACIP